MPAFRTFRQGKRAQSGTTGGLLFLLNKFSGSRKEREPFFYYYSFSSFFFFSFLFCVVIPSRRLKKREGKKFGVSGFFFSSTAFMCGHLTLTPFTLIDLENGGKLKRKKQEPKNGTRSKSFGRNFCFICIAIPSDPILTQIWSIYYANFSNEIRDLWPPSLGRVYSVIWKLCWWSWRAWPI